MKSLTKILGGFKILFALILFCIDAYVITNYAIEGGHNGWQIAGFLLAFSMVLFYALFLGYNGFEDIMTKRLLSSLVKWLGIIMGLVLSVILYFSTETIAGKALTQFYSVFSLIEIIRITTKKTATN